MIFELGCMSISEYKAYIGNEKSDSPFNQRKLYLCLSVFICG